MPIRIEEVDERDSSWEDSSPRFRVYLHGSDRDTTAGWTATYDVTGADVLQVVDWAQHQASDRLTYAIALVGHNEVHERLNPGRGRGLTWLLGTDGNANTTGNAEEAEVQRRMLRRREDPVVLGSADTMPPKADA